MTFLRNIGADLLEKRLWPVALALIVGLVAVPTLLAKSSGGEPVPQTAAIAAGEAAKADAVVALDTKPVGRRKRGGRSKNPFKQLYVPKVKTETTVTATSASSEPSKDTSGGGSTAPAPKVTPAPQPKSKPKPKPKSKSKPKSSLAVYKVKLHFGQAGAMRTISDVARLTPLPSADDPFFVFLGVKADGKTLVFLVGSDAKATGDGKCKPSGADCETIEMQAGDTEYFDVTSDAGVEQYQMDIVSISKSKASSAKVARKARARRSKAGAALLRAARRDAQAPEMLGIYRWNSARGVLEVVPRKKRKAKVAVGALAGTSSVR